MNKQKRKKAIDWAMKRIGVFGKDIAPIFEYNRWTWHDSEDPPTHYGIENGLRKLLAHLIDYPKSTNISSGRLKVELSEDVGVVGIHISVEVDDHYV